MPAERAYVIEVLKTVKRKSARADQLDMVVSIDNMIDRVIGNDDVRLVVESFYRTPGLDEFALRLLWMLERMRVDGGIANPALMAYGVEKLFEALPKP